MDVRDSQDTRAAAEGRGGPGRGQGRKPVGEEPMIPVTVKMQPKQKEKLSRLGGSKWIRDRIDQAKEPGS